MNIKITGKIRSNVKQSLVENTLNAVSKAKASI